MKRISRRQFIYLSALLSVSHPWSLVASSSKGDTEDQTRPFHTTVAVLKEAYDGEMAAHRRYVRYSEKAVEESYPNIAYFFTAFSISEKIHADNFKTIASTLGAVMRESRQVISLQDTKLNLKDAAERELLKIEETYPDYLERLKTESHEQAVTHCVYALKCHQQHEEKICEIDTYCKRFFGPVAKRIEGKKLDFHVCSNCGSTMNQVPQKSCIICAFPVHFYKKVERPTQRFTNG